MHRIAFGALLMFCASSAGATTFKYKFEMPAFTQGNSVGKTSTLFLRVDNGRSTNLSQSYLNTDVTRLEFFVEGSAGVKGTLDLLYNGSGVMVRTNAAGVATLDLTSPGDACVYAFFNRDPSPPREYRQLVSICQGFAGVGSFDYLSFGQSLQDAADDEQGVIRASAVYLGNLTPVPIPGALPLLLAGLGGLGLMARRKRNG